jgi:hypothetical protein
MTTWTQGPLRAALRGQVSVTISSSTICASQPGAAFRQQTDAVVQEPTTHSVNLKPLAERNYAVESDAWNPVTRVICEAFVR